VVGVLSGLDFGHRLIDDRQFAGAHNVAATLAFNVGVLVGELGSLLLVLVALSIVFPYVTGQRLGVVILSPVLRPPARPWVEGGGEWMGAGGHRLEQAATALASTSSAPIVGWWMLLGLLVGGAAWFLPEQFDRGGPDGA